MQTQENQTLIAAPIVVNNAEAKRDALIATNEAIMRSFLTVTETEAIGYQAMSSQLGF